MTPTDPMDLFAVWSCDAQGRCTHWQAATAGLLPPAHGLPLVQWLQQAGAEPAGAALGTLTAAFAARQPFQVEVPVLCADGSAQRLMLCGLPAGDGHQGFVLDVGARQAALESALRTAVQDRLLVTHSTDLIAHCDLQGRYVSISPSYGRLIGWTDAELVGRLVTDLLHPDDRAPAEAALAHLMGGGEIVEAVEVRKRHRDGHYVTVGTKASPVMDSAGQCLGAVLVSRDIRREKARIQNLETLARHDVLTGLPNRVWIEEHLQTLLAVHDDGAATALLFIDLNGFKAVNDRQGHAAGDELLRQVGRRLQQGMRPGDAVARLGGDEFVVVARCSDARAAARLAQRLLDSLEQPFCVQEQPVRIGASIGISLAGDDTHCTALLLRRADAAMYQAKACDRSAFRFFEADGGLHHQPM